jgi:hypothetical protein
LSRSAHSQRHSAVRTAEAAAHLDSRCISCTLVLVPLSKVINPSLVDVTRVSVDSQLRPPACRRGGRRRNPAGTTDCRDDVCRLRAELIERLVVHNQQLCCRSWCSGAGESVPRHDEPGLLNAMFDRWKTRSRRAGWLTGTDKRR